MQRIVLLVIASLAAPFSAAQNQKPDTAQDIVENLGLAIQKGDSAGAIALFDPQASGLAEMRRDLEALSALPNTNCAITIAKTSSSGDSITFEADWSLQTYPVQNGPLLDRSDHIVLSLKRSGQTWKIISLTPAFVLAPPDPGVFALIAHLAADLNDKNQSEALGAFDSKMKQYGEIDNDIDALISQNDILCAIDIVTDRQTGGVHTLDLDWLLQLKSRADGGPVQQRRERVTAKVEKIGRKWRIVNLDSLKALSPENSR